MPDLGFCGIYKIIFFRKLGWKGRLKISGEQLNQLRFAVEMVLVANISHEINEMLQELSARSKKVGLKISASETKVVQSLGLLPARLQIDGMGLQEVDSYVYFGQEICDTITSRRLHVERLLIGVADVLKMSNRKNGDR
ncbi:unnamed protein product [Gongylonema pulchrum]|uniref:Costars domain-containing protein n=1 Tax=Gongylonema pulchrum TaxID=637853 RepID=A0A183DDS5_9BILA|nr:unnamed protein product [Gongylonema pulchrum]